MKHPGNLLVDAHVHYYPCFPRRLFLEAARRSFRSAATRLGLGGSWTPFLLLTESRGHRWFRLWREEAERGEVTAGWRLLPTAEPDSLRAVPGEADDRGEPAGERGIVVVAGRQTRTRQGLEVLGLGRDHAVEDGGELVDTVLAVLESGALPVIPWGFGKWWGGRGRRVEELLRAELASRVFLGDNAGRPALAPPPRLFRLAAERNVPILPGSDPLPFPRHASRAGSYGFVLPAGGSGELAGADERPSPDEDRGPAARLLHELRRRPPVRVWGRRAGVLQFFRDQLAMQIRNRRGGAPAS